MRITPEGLETRKLFGRPVVSSSLRIRLLESADGKIRTDYLAPSHHSRGILTSAFNLLLHSWGIPKMGIQRMRVNAFEGNIGSIRVFKKNGFVQREIVKDCLEVRGEKKSMFVLEWAREE
jgi:RimJ/RimL family protein N-acetyltransferase